MAKTQDLKVLANLEERKVGAQMDSKVSVITAWNSGTAPNGALRAREEQVAKSVGWEAGNKSGVKAQEKRGKRQSPCSPGGCNRRK